MITGALIAALALCAALTAMLFWQAKRAARSADRLLAKSEVYADLRISLAAGQVALSDKERALNMVTAERDRLQFTLDTVEDQRDALLKESLEHATPGTIAVSVRDALSKLRDFPPHLPEAEDLPNVPSE